MAKVIKFRSKATNQTYTIPDYRKAAKNDFKLTQDELFMIQGLRELPSLERGRIFAYVSGAVASYKIMN